MNRRRRLILAGNKLGVINGLLAWYDTTNANYLTLVSSAITQFLDRSGNGFDTPVQGTSTARPTWAAGEVNGLPAAIFDGGDFLDANTNLYSLANGNNSTFIVSKRTVEDASTQYPFSFTEGGSVRQYVRYSATAGNVLSMTNNGATGGASSSGNTNTDYQIIAGERSGTTLTTTVNGTNIATNSNGDSEPGIDGGTIGSLAAGGYLDGGVVEKICYNRKVSAEEFKLIMQYLSIKYNISVTL